MYAGGGITKMALVVLAMVAGGVYAMHASELHPIIGVAIAVSIAVTIVPAPAEANRIPRWVGVVCAALASALGLATVWATNAPAERAARILHDLGWTQVALAGWLTYSNAVALSATRSAPIPFDDAARTRWREGDLGFGVELANRVIVRARRSWVALVVETAWPEPRPELVAELLRIADGAKIEEVRELLSRMQGKGGAELAEAKWELARAACEVIVDAEGRSGDEVGGVVVGRFALAAAKVVRDDEDAVRVFSALVLPAIARLERRVR